ncbi:hypothetical protein N4R57_14115 [Rhodobacteraceae bacterium D3-12]|nr:hypothetical protein N4R57_14115 [Rhodobacteraceae bacterium D3-12]
MRLFLPLMLLASLVAVGLALVRPELSDILLLAVPIGLASGWLWLSNLRRPAPPPPKPPQTRPNASSSTAPT